MTTMYTIDTTTRALEVGVAEVTKCDLGTIVRPQVMLGRLEDLVANATREQPLRLDYPVLLVGGGYRARSSAGFVSVDTWNRWYPATCVVAGEYRRTGDIRPHRPVHGGILPPCTVWADGQFGWSNEAAASILLQQNPGEVVITEGQSNWARGYHLAAPEGAWQTFDFDNVVEVEWSHKVLRALSPENYATGSARPAHTTFARCSKH